MNHQQLDEKLRKLSSKEIDYRDKNVVPTFYNKLQKINIGNQEVYVFDDTQKLTEDVFIIRHNRFAEVPQHIHTFIEMNYVYSGKCTQIIDNNVVEISQGELCIIDTRVPHSISATSENDIILNILIRKEFFSASFISRLSNNGVISDFIINAISDAKNHNRYIIFHSENNQNLLLLIKQLLCEYFDRALCATEIINCYLVLIFSELIRVFQYDTNKRKKRTSNIVDILNYIELSDLHISLKATAKHFNYDPNYLSYLIKKETGKSFTEIIQNKKLTYAAYLLVSSEIPIYQIAVDTGHNNLNYFYKKFQEKYGTKPLEFRNSHKQN